MSNIKVCVRTRPIDESRKEKWAAGFEIHGRRITFGMKNYDPDVTLQPTATQDDVFSQCTPIIEAVKDGANGTILVYGQTGTGKTHTMIGGEGCYDGVAIRSIQNMLDHVTEGTLEGKKMALSLSVLEIYNEKITDMLSDSDAEVSLINGVPRATTTVALTNMDAAVDTVRRALNSRHVSQTAMNDRSSRSHVLFILDLQEVTGTKTEVAKLYLVDLAGSESLKKSQAQGKAASEAGMINKSLLALKTVINTLSESNGNKQQVHVPYRDSRLTELLQDSIGGTARTMFVACVSPNGRDIEETKSTLEYATKARSIKNVSNTERDKLRARIRTLEIDVQKLQNRLSDRISERNGYFVTKEEHEQQVRTLEDFQRMQTDLTALMEERTAYQVKSHVTESQMAIYQSEIDMKNAEISRMQKECMGALEKFHATTSIVEASVVAHVNRIEGLVNGHMESANGGVQRALAAAQDPELTTPMQATLAAVLREANQRHVEAAKRVVSYVDTLAAKMKSAQDAQHAAVQASLARMASVVIEESNAAKRAMNNAMADMQSEADICTDMANRVATAPIDIAASTSTDAALRDVQEATAARFRALEPLQAGDDLHKALCDAKYAVRAAALSTTVDAFGGVGRMSLSTSSTAMRAPSLPSVAGDDQLAHSTPSTPTSTGGTDRGSGGKNAIAIRKALAPTASANATLGAKRVRSTTQISEEELRRRRSMRPTAAPKRNV